MRIRLAVAEDASACNDFFNRYYSEGRTLKQWRWEFCSSLHDDLMVPFVLVEDGGYIVGTQAMIPVPMVDDKGVFWTAKSEETLVDPHYRGKRLFARMYEVLFDYAKSNNILAIWGFTPAQRAFNKLGFCTPARTAQLFRPFSGRSMSALLHRYFDQRHVARPLLVRRIGSSLAGAGASKLSSAICAVRSILDKRVAIEGFEIKTLTKPPMQAGDLCVSFVKQWGGATIYRNSEYLQWRVFDNPHIMGVLRAAYLYNQLIGWIIYSLDNDSMGYIVDVMAIDANVDDLTAEMVIKRLLIDAMESLQKAGAIGVRAWHVNDHPFSTLAAHLMKRMGFFFSKRGYQVVIYPQLECIDRESLRLFDGWFLSRIYTQGYLG